MRIYARIPKNDSIEIRITGEQFRGKLFVNIREWWRPSSGADFVPTKKGMTYDVENNDQIIEALQAINAVLETEGVKEFAQEQPEAS